MNDYKKYHISFNLIPVRGGKFLSVSSGIKESIYLLGTMGRILSDICDSSISKIFRLAFTSPNTF